MEMGAKSFLIAVLSISNSSSSTVTTVVTTEEATNEPPKGDDGCDKYLWRRCTNNEECNDFNAFRDLSWANTIDFDNDPSAYPHSWQDIHHDNFSNYQCVVPPISGCTVKRCVPILQSGFDCVIDSDCFDGEACHYPDDTTTATTVTTPDTKEVITVGTCGSCGDTPGYAYGACHQVKTNGAGGTPPFEEGESGCAGDHCLHVCSYDTKCMRVLSNTTFMDLTGVHNALGPVKIESDQVRALVTRPSTCGATDEGTNESGMRCAAPLHRTITQFHRTPDTVRGRYDNIVELGFEWYNNYMMLDTKEQEHSSVTDFDGNHVFVGTVIPDIATLQQDTTTTNNSNNIFDNAAQHYNNDEDEGVIVGKGLYAYGLANWHFGREGLVTCDVRYTDNAPLHINWGDVVVDESLKRSTLQTRVCVRWRDYGDTVVTFNDDDNDIVVNFGNDDRWCSDWSTTTNIADYNGILPFRVSCTLAGPNVSRAVPNEEQRDLMIENIRKAYQDKSVTGPPLLRTSFHDAAVYAPPGLGLIKGGSQGCIRFEHVQSNEGNSGLHFTIDNIGPSVGCGFIRNNNVSAQHESCPWSVADIIQFVGAFASAEMMTSWDVDDGLDSILTKLRWGRPDAPMILCQGELQLNQPDHDGGHLAGFFKHGSSIGGDVSMRLLSTFESMREFFEERLELNPKHWIAIMGAHSVGGVRGLIQARNTRFFFDETPNVLDNKYFERLVLALASNLVSLCPMHKKMGHAHWWGPGENWDSSGDHWLTLLDIDVSMIFNTTALGFLHSYATDEEAWLIAFREAFLLIGEKGYGNDALFEIPTKKTCKEKVTWKYKGKKNKTCYWVLSKRNKRCTKKAKGVEANDACPIACKSTKCTQPKCWKSSDWKPNKGNFNCVKIKKMNKKEKKKACASIGTDKTFGYEVCKHCNVCEY